MEPGLALGKGMNLTYFINDYSFVENNRCRQVKVYKSQFHFEYFIGFHFAYVRKIAPICAALVENNVVQNPVGTESAP